MIRISLICCILLLVPPSAYSQSDKEILDTVRASATKIYLKQASWTLPESFHNSGLAPSDKERLIKQWANASAACLVDALATYEPLGPSVTEAAEGLGVTRKTLSAVLNGRAGISPEMALRLSIAFDTSPESWLNQQTQYDLWAAQKYKKELRVRKLSAA